jgi:hypothetical protein
MNIYIYNVNTDITVVNFTIKDIKLIVNNKSFYISKLFINFTLIDVIK